MTDQSSTPYYPAILDRVYNAALRLRCRRIVFTQCPIDAKRSNMNTPSVPYFLSPIAATTETQRSNIDPA